MDLAALLPHVRRMQRRLRQGPAGGGHAAFPDLLGWLRAVRAGPRAGPRIAGGDGRGALQPVPGMHRELPIRGAGDRAAVARAGTVRMTAAALVLAGSGLVAAGPVPTCDLAAGWAQQGAARSYDA